MSIEIGAKLGNLNIGATLVSPRQQKNDEAGATQELTGDIIRDAGRPAQLLQDGPLEQLLDTPSPLDRFSDIKR
ncbi:hypothetical protein Q9Q95_11855 [Sphingomonas sp. DG1-23]|jgi:hypothetical protein|uniref:hypothetical protein n=1 Tax=Sphingomonas sp. DG1-23 TaxID=3068316 RepID=UPI00273F80B9|nr:hypothetical protein [Sphingomonas sp. DG1-23]MDP5279617.1 hypothetical protein [Sphingomonas sp. DG1-23]